MNSTTETLAKALLDAASSGIACAPIRDQIETIRSARKPMPSAVEVAYEVQCHNTAIAQASGRRVVGRKIGLTSLAVQKQLGVDQPDFGTLFADMARLEGLPIPWHHTMQPKVEAEVALVLKDDLLFDRHTVADIINATAYALPAIEIVGSRISNWDIRLVDTVADNASSGLFVLGSKPVQLGLLDLLNCAMRMTRDDEVVSEGHGAACLGNPLNAAVWLADTMVRFKTPLRAGQVILTGALGPMAIVKAGQTFTAHIDGLGTVSAVFGAEESKVAE